MRDGYVEVPVTSRAAQAELERQEARRRAAAEGGAAPFDANDAPGSEKDAGPERKESAPTPRDV
jgi:hypothetical protein